MRKSIITEFKDIKNIIKEYYEHLYAYNSTTQTDKFLQRHKLKIMLNQEEVVTWLALHSLKTFIFPQGKTQGQDCFTGDFYKIYKEEIKPILYKHIQKTEEKAALTRRANSVTKPKTL